jgi:hypothetical protein
MDTVQKYLEGALVLIAVYLVVTNFVGFASAVGALSGAANSSFKTLQGR